MRGIWDLEVPWVPNVVLASPASEDNVYDTFLFLNLFTSLRSVTHWFAKYEDVSVSQQIMVRLGDKVRFAEASTGSLSEALFKNLHLSVELLC